MERKGVHHTRMELRSQLMAQGSTKSANATAVGVMNRSTSTMKGTFLSAWYTRGASAAMLAMGLVDCSHSMRMGYGSPISMARRTESSWATTEPYW